MQVVILECEDVQYYVGTINDPFVADNLWDELTADFTNTYIIKFQDMSQEELDTMQKFDGF